MKLDGGKWLEWTMFYALRWVASLFSALISWIISLSHFSLETVSYLSGFWGVFLKASTLLCKTVLWWLCLSVSCCQFSLVNFCEKIQWDNKKMHVVSYKARVHRELSHDYWGASLAPDLLCLLFVLLGANHLQVLLSSLSIFLFPHGPMCWTIR